VSKTEKFGIDVQGTAITVLTQATADFVWERIPGFNPVEFTGTRMQVGRRRKK